MIMHLLGNEAEFLALPYLSIQLRKGSPISSYYFYQSFAFRLLLLLFNAHTQERILRKGALFHMHNAPIFAPAHVRMYACMRLIYCLPLSFGALRLVGVCVFA